MYLCRYALYYVLQKHELLPKYCIFKEYNICSLVILYVFFSHGRSAIYQTAEMTSDLHTVISCLIFLCESLCCVRTFGLNVLAYILCSAVFTCRILNISDVSFDFGFLQALRLETLMKVFRLQAFLLPIDFYYFYK